MNRTLVLVFAALAACDVGPDEAPAARCAATELEIDGACVPDPAGVLLDATSPLAPPRPYVGTIRVTELTITPVVEPELLRVHSPVRVTVGLSGEPAEPTNVNVLIGLRASDGSTYCVLGLTGARVRAGETARVTSEHYIDPRCLHGDTLATGATGATGTPAATPTVVRDVQGFVRVDPYDEVRQSPDDEALHRPGIVFDAHYSLADTAGLDIALAECNPQSSIIFLPERAPAPAGSPHPFADATGSYDDRRADIIAQIAIRAHGVANEGADRDEIDVLAGGKLQVAFALRPAKNTASHGWVPLTIVAQRPGEVSKSYLELEHLVARRPKLGTLELNFADGCAERGDCSGRSVHELLQGAWRGERVFDLRACVAAVTEVRGHEGNNCRETQLVILREHEAFDGYLPNAIVQIADCPPRLPNEPAQVCFAAPTGRHPLVDYSGGKSSSVWAGLTFDLKGRMDATMAALHSEGRATLAALGGEVLGDDRDDPGYDAKPANAREPVTFACQGWERDPSTGQYRETAGDGICIELVHAWAHGGAYADSDLYEEDPNAVPCAPPSLVPPRKQFVAGDAAEDCKRSFRCKRKPAGSAAFTRCVQTCVNRKRQEGVAQSGGACRLLPVGIDECPASGRPTGCDCQRPPESDPEGPVAYDGKAETDVHVAQQRRSFAGGTPGAPSVAKTCYSCAAGAVWDMGDEGAACFAYYSLGLAFFGRQVFGLDYAGQRIGYEHPISFAKRWEKQRTFFAGPVPINVGVAVSGEIGIKLGVWLEGKLGSPTRKLDARHCAPNADPAGYRQLCGGAPELDGDDCVCAARLPDDWCAKGFVDDKGEFERVCDGPSHPGADACQCDPSCVSYGDCCIDYAWTCELGLPPAPTVDLRVPDEPGAQTICLSPECRQHLDGANMVLALVFSATPFASLGAEAWAGLDLLVIKVLVKGVIDIVRIDLPIQVRILFGLFGSGRAECADGKCKVKPLSLFEGRLLAEIGALLDIYLLGGSIKIALEHINIKWCDIGLFDIPCGFQYTEFWSYELVDLDKLLGFKFREVLFAKGSKPLVFQFLERPTVTVDGPNGSVIEVPIGDSP